jgi:type IV pilus assembly protein PilM
MDFFDFFAKPSKPMLGMDIFSSAVKLIELSKTGDSFKVEAYRVLPLPPNTIVDKNIADLDALSETIAAVVKRSGTKLTDIVSALPFGWTMCPGTRLWKLSLKPRV